MPHHTDSRDYYVSVQRDNRRALVAGPFATHTEALALVDKAREVACGLNSWHDFDAFGTASLPRSDTNPPGKLNTHLGVKVR